MSLVDALVQRLILRDHRAHQHVGATGGIFGQRLHDDIDTVFKRSKTNTC